MNAASYTVTRRDGLTIVEGAVPLGDMVALMGNAGPDDIADTSLPRVLGASLVMGSPEACKRERERLGLTRTPPVEIAEADTAVQIAEWEKRGDVGASSETVARHLTGRPLTDGATGALPADADDFTRCSLLLDWAPALRERLGELASLSPAWAALVEAWPTLEALLANGSDGRAEIHARLRVIREEV